MLNESFSGQTLSDLLVFKLWTFHKEKVMRKRLQDELGDEETEDKEPLEDDCQ